MFCHGDLDSVKVIKEVIDEFGDVSGLLPNYNKSTIIFGCINDEDRQKILDVVPFGVKKLPVKYLGVPLITKMIGVKNQSDHVNGKAKVAWKNLCMPKAKDGLDLKNLSVWNKAMITKHLWVLEKFIVRNAYHDLQSRQENVSWKDLVWFSQNIPKHAFILWQAIKGNLTTQDKMRKLSTYDMLVCPLCFNDIDSHSHLFFRCEYAKNFWLMVNKKIEVRINERDCETTVNKFADIRNGNLIGSVERSHATAKEDRLDLLKGECFCLVIPTSNGPFSISRVVDGMLFGASG
nr:hypothetical protein [Tanacetum cinerariifolium]